jgi:hypothetical protein
MSYRVRVFVALALAPLLVGAPGVARAQQAIDSGLASKRHQYNSPQNFAAEVRFSAFTPAIDSDPSLHGAAPYAQVFGTGPRLLVSAEFDWQALRIPHLGTLGPGIGAGFTAASGNAMFAMEHNGTYESGETTSLDIYPFDALAVLRIDVLWHDLGVPIVPNVKAGFGVALWRATNTLGTSVYTDPKTNQSVSGEGHSIGTHVALGIAFNLNVLDESAARDWDESSGVNSTYLFAEWTREDLDGLGLQAAPLRVGGTSWTFGLAFEF